MNKWKRYFFQVVLWLGIWAVLWILEDDNRGFLYANLPAFAFQCVLLAGLIFYSVPRLLFQKKYAYFFTISILAIGLFAFAAFQFGPNTPPMRGPHPEMGPGTPPRGAPRYFIHLLMLAISYILATFLETFIFAQKKEEETIRNKNENLQTELKLLKSQINPHFLFNSLNNIYALSAIDSGKTQQSISYLSDMLRYVLYECDHELVPLEKEIAYIKNYIKLFSLKRSDPYPITVDFNMSNQNTRVAPMLFIPFVENAIKHSNIEQVSGTFIRMKVEATGDDIHFEIENSKPERPMVTDGVGGIGIENVKKRLAILYPNNTVLNISDTLTVFKVSLKINLNGND